MTHYLRALWAKLRGLFGDRRAEPDLDDEIEAHLRLLAERYVRQGMTEDEAAWAARRQFGNITLLKETSREMRGIGFIETIFQDLRHGMWMLRRNPGFTFVTVFTLALGIGANTAIFSVVNAVLLRSLPYRDPDRLMIISHYGAQGVSDLVSGMDFLKWRDQAKAFEQIAAYRTDTVDLTGLGEPERLSVGLVSANLFRVFGITPALGRAFTLEEDIAGGAPVAILSDGLWRRRFGGDPQVIGQALILGGQSRTVVGIMPHGFRSPREYDLWFPLALKVTKESNFIRTPSVSVIARLKPGVTPEAARADLSVILERQRQQISSDDPQDDRRVRVINLSDWLVGNIRLALLVLFGAGAFVLLIASANVTNLLLAQSAARKKEMAIRAIVGAGRLRLAQQLLTESFLLSLAGGAAGLLAANWGVKLLVAMSPAGIARIEESGVDGRVLGFTCVIAALVGLITGIFPTLQASKTDVNETLKLQSAVGGAQSVRGKGQRALPALVIAELALALVLLVGAGLMIKSFLRLLAVPKGFNPDGVLTLELSRVSRTKYPMGSPQRRAYFQEVIARVRALPGIQSAGLTGFLPLTGSNLGVNITETRPGFEQKSSVDVNHITLDYFQTMGIEIRAGRPFAAQDGAKSQQVAIINETLARRLFQKENPIGQQLKMSAESTPRTIVGVVGDTRHAGLDQGVNPEVYLPYMQPFLQNPIYVTYLNLAVRVSSSQNNPISLAGLAANIRKQVRAIDLNEPVNQVVTMDDRLSNSVAWRRFQMLLLGVFGGIALVIATVGIYGVISYAVSRRTHEIGVRMALGAQASDVLRMVIWRGMRLTLVGVTLGVAAALALTRVLRNLLFEVSATDPATFALITLLLVAVALIASYIPARRATRVDPLQALRHE
ncbi:MAG TPA: ABC transporter permease [Blastocatellia bacterium]|nr:ABC transporter permease [Blastocatellia bacterium]